MAKPDVGLNVADLTKESYVVPATPAWTNQKAVTVCNPDGTPVIEGASISIGAVSGNLTNNNAPPAANNIGVLPAVANAAAPTWTEGDQVLLSENLSGSLRTIISAALPAGTNVIGHIIADSGSTTVVTGNVTVVQPTGSNLHTVIDSGTVTANPPTAPATNTITQVASSASSVTLHALSATRQALTIYNDSTQVLYVSMAGGTASNTNYSVQIASQGYFEAPKTVDGTVYTGAITGIWASANGNAYVCETTP